MQELLHGAKYDMSSTASGFIRAITSGSKHLVIPRFTFRYPEEKLSNSRAHCLYSRSPTGFFAQTNMVSTASPSKQRDRHEIIALILKAASEPITRNGVMYQAMLNFRQVQDYVPTLLERGLLESVNGSKTDIVVIDKGRRCLRLFVEGKKLMEGEPCIYTKN